MPSNSENEPLLNAPKKDAETGSPLDKLPSGKSIDSAFQNGLINFTDFWHTLIRVWQVFTDMIANARAGLLNGADSTPNANSNFNQTVYTLKGQLTAAGVGAIASSALAVAMGLFYTGYKYFYARYLRSTKRLQKKMSAYADDANEAQTEVDTAINQYNQAHLDKKIIHENGLLELKRQSSAPFSVFTKKPKNTILLDEHRQPLRKKTRLNWINRFVNSRPVALLAKPWNWMVNQSMWYWVVWFFAVLVVGSSALSLATIAAPVLLPIVSVTLAIGLTISAIKMVGRVRTYLDDRAKRAAIASFISDKNHTPIHDDILKDEVFKASIIAIDNHLKTASKNSAKYKDLGNSEKAKLILAKFKKHKAKDDAASESGLSHWITRVFSEFVGMKIRGKDNLPAIADIQPKDRTLRDSKLAEYVIPSKHERRLFTANRVIGQMTFGFVIPFFITSLVAAIGLAIVPHLAFLGITAAAIKGSAIFAVINGSVLPSIWGVVKTALFGVSTFASRRQAELDYKIKVAQTLTPDKVAEFNALERVFNENRTKIMANARMRENLKRVHKDFETWSPYNTAMFEEHSDKKTAWSWSRKGLRNFFELIAGAQTGVLIIRFTCLAGMVGLGFLTGGIAPAIFLSVAAVAGVVFGVNRLVSWHMDRRQKHRDNFLNTFDQRIQFLKDVNARFTTEIAAVDHSKPTDTPAAVNALDASSTLEYTPSGSSGSFSRSASPDLDFSGSESDNHKAAITVESINITVAAATGKRVHVSTFFAPKPQLFSVTTPVAEKSAEELINMPARAAGA